MAIASHNGERKLKYVFYMESKITVKTYVYQQMGAYCLKLFSNVTVNLKQWNNG